MKKTNKNNNHKFLNKNYIKGALSGALALTILCSGVGVAAYSAGADNTAQALGVQTESTVEAVKKASTTKEALKKLSKNETVYVIADANGAAKKIIVSDWLKGVDTKGKVKDVSKLKDVKNVKGDETYTVNEDNAYEWAANGDDIYYQGTGTTELPVKLKLSYKLNGKTVSADEIAGKSGKVTIRIDYENTQKEKVKINGKTEEVNVPFLMLSGMILDDDKFKNVEVSNGKAINDGTRTIVAGFALPGMQDSLDIDKDEMEIPDYVEITADTVFTAIFKEIPTTTEAPTTTAPTTAAPTTTPAPMTEKATTKKEKATKAEKTTKETTQQPATQSVVTVSAPKTGYNRNSLFMAVFIGFVAVMGGIVLLVADRRKRR